MEIFHKQLKFAHFLVPRVEIYIKKIIFLFLFFWIDVIIFLTIGSGALFFENPVLLFLLGSNVPTAFRKNMRYIISL